MNYGKVHYVLTRDRGKPYLYKCIECGTIAEEWAYRGTDPDQMYDEKRKMFYSIDPNYYDPMCRSCHRGTDQAKEYCPQGHKFTESNIYWDKSRKGTLIKRCRTCVIERAREYRKRKRLQ